LARKNRKDAALKPEVDTAASKPGADVPDIAALNKMISSGFAEMREYIDNKIDDVSTQVGEVQDNQQEMQQSVPRIDIVEGPGRPHRTMKAAGSPEGYYTENYSGLIQTEHGGGKQIPVGSDGLRVPKLMLDAFKPQFHPGDRALIKRDTQKDGAWQYKVHEDYDHQTGNQRRWYEILKDDSGNQIPLLWGDILDKVGHNGEVQVVKTAFFSEKVMQWKYRCLAPGLGDGANGADSFWDYELEPVGN